MYKDNSLVNRLEEILESIQLIKEWSEGRNTVADYMTSSTGVMVFNACVMRLQVIGEHVGKLLKDSPDLLAAYPDIPWLAIYDMRNIISHEYANIDEEIVVSVINDDLDSLESVVKQMIDQLKNEEIS